MKTVLLALGALFFTTAASAGVIRIDFTGAITSSDTVIGGNPIEVHDVVTGSIIFDDTDFVVLERTDDRSRHDFNGGSFELLVDGNVFFASDPVHLRTIKLSQGQDVERVAVIGRNDSGGPVNQEPAPLSSITIEFFGETDDEIIPDTSVPSITALNDLFAKAITQGGSALFADKGSSRFQFSITSVNATAVPAPPALLFMATGMAGFLAARRRRRR